MKIAVTGATGFLGRAVVAHALERGHVVRALVRAEEQHRERRALPEVLTRAEVIRGALEDPSAILRLLEGADAFLHLAAVGVQSEGRTWAGVVEPNVVAPLRLLERVSPRTRVVMVGTALEYAGHGTLPDAPESKPTLCREDSALSELDPYAASKAAGGLLARAFARERGTALWYLRLASVYGPGDHPDKVVAAALAAARERRPFEMSPGEQVRDWLLLSDATRAIMLTLEREPPAPGTVLNIGSGEGVELRTLIRELFRLAGAEESLVRVGARRYRRAEPHRIVLDVSAASAILGFRPSVSLQDGLKMLVHGGA